MSRGPGRWQRAILQILAAGSPVAITHADFTHAEQNALRRAANRLEAHGKLKLTSQSLDGHPRLVAYPLDADAPAVRVVMGLDGKSYRLPGN